MSEPAAEPGPSAGRAGQGESVADLPLGVPGQGAEPGAYAGRGGHGEPPADLPVGVPGQGVEPGAYAGRGGHGEPPADLPGAVPEQRAADEDGAAAHEDAPARPEPLGVAVPPTGNADVDAALARLADADELPTHSHIEVYEDVHHGLRDALAALDENRS
ncbi:hypothetical protein ACWERV_34565 [Streptomyces sp. NPDC004031]